MNPPNPRVPLERFFNVEKPVSLKELAAHVPFSLLSPQAESHMIHDILPLDQAGPEHISFFDNRKYLHALKATRAGACLVKERDVQDVPAGTIPLITKDPYQAYACGVQYMYRNVGMDMYPEGCHPTAHIHPSARIGTGCRIGAFTVIGENVILGDNTYIGSHVWIGAGCQIGQDCRISTHTTVTYSIIGHRVMIHAGARLGQTGFGFHMNAQGFTHIPHIGRVIVHDDVRIGANTTIDRGSLEDTVIGKSVMIDNLVQIGHNVFIGSHCVLAGQVGIAGSARIEPECLLGGQSGVKGHITVGRGTQLAAKGGITNDTPPKSILAGFPAQPIQQWRRWIALQKKWLRSHLTNIPSSSTES